MSLTDKSKDMKVSEIEIGKTYNGVKVLEDIGTIGGDRRYKCKCPRCENEFVTRASSVGKIHTCKKCSRLGFYLDISGQRFGRLVAIEYVGRKKSVSQWKCVCDCGNIIITTQSRLKQGCVKSCGCLKKESSLWGGNQRHCASLEFGVIHKHPLYTTWNQMKSRCYYPKNNRYKHYGARGIKVCDRWLGENGFENFVTDMGERPSNRHSLDRIDLNGDYTPTNCRWATYEEQNRNRSNTFLVSYNGNIIPLAQLCEDYNLSYRDIYNKIKQGRDINEIIKNYIHQKS